MAELPSISYQPLGDRVLLRPMERPTRMPSGIVLPPSRDSVGRGEVLAHGPGQVSDRGITLPMTVKVGDIVIFHREMADEIMVEGNKLLVINEKLILAKEKQ